MKLKWTYKIYDRKWNLLTVLDNAIQWTAKSFIQGYYMGTLILSSTNYRHKWLLYDTQLYLGTDNTTATEWDCNTLSTTWTNMNTVFTQAQWPYTSTARQWDYVSKKASNTYSIPSSAQGTYNEIGIVSKPFQNATTMDWLYAAYRVWVSRANWPIVIPDWWAIIVYEIEVDSFTFANGRQAQSVTNSLSNVSNEAWFWGNVLQWVWNNNSEKTEKQWYWRYMMIWTSDNTLAITDTLLWSQTQKVETSWSLIVHRSNWSKNILVRDITWIFTNLPIWTYKELWIWVSNNNNTIWLRQIKDRVVTSATNQVTVNFRLLLD